MSIRIVIDRTCDSPDEVIESLGIKRLALVHTDSPELADELRRGPGIYCLQMISSALISHR